MFVGAMDRRKAAWTAASRYRWLLLPPAAFLVVFFAWPLILVLARGFTEPQLGLQNYARMLDTKLYALVLYNTIETTLIVTLLCLTIAYPVAYVMSTARGWLLHLMAALVIIPLWTSAVIRSYAWMVVFQRRGVLNEAIVGLGLAEEPLRFIPGTLAVNVGMVHIMLPFMILPLLANMRGIDRSLLRAAEVMGANPFSAFVRVFLPLSLPGITAGSAVVFMLSLGFFITPALLGGPRHMMAAVLIEQQANQFFDWGLASALSSVLLVITLVIYFAYVRLTGGAAGEGFARKG